jgi:hypothetical protein
MTADPKNVMVQETYDVTGRDEEDEEDDEDDWSSSESGEEQSPEAIQEVEQNLLETVKKIRAKVMSGDEKI